MTEPFQADHVRGWLHRPETNPIAAMVLVHGAGSNCNAPLIVAIASELVRLGVLVFRGDLPFRQARAAGPPRPADSAKDREGIRRAIEAIKLPGVPTLAGGHSYGGRQTTMLASEDSKIAAALLLLSYPLHPPDKPEKLRTAHLPSLETPCFFVHGARDPFGSIEEMTAALKLIPARTHLEALANAAHDLGSAGKKADFVKSFLEFSYCAK